MLLLDRSKLLVHTDRNIWCYILMFISNLSDCSHFSHHSLSKMIFQNSSYLDLIHSTLSRRLELLPIEIEEQRPSDKSLKFVLDFAKQTGDVRSLSNTDLAGNYCVYNIIVYISS